MTKFQKSNFSFGMPKNLKNREGGFVKLLLSIVIALIILSYFGFDLRTLIENPQTQENLNYFWNLLKTFWFDYIWKGILFVWNYIVELFSKIFSRGE
jgi:hypothetical protein